MNKNITRDERRQLERDNLKWPLHMKLIPRDDWPEAVYRMKEPPREVWRSRHYLAQIFVPPGHQAHARISVCRAAVGGNGEWQDNIPWDDLQRIKREVGFGELTAVELYPPDMDVVNVANMRHLWVLSGDLDFAWRRGPTADAARRTPTS